MADLLGQMLMPDRGVSGRQSMPVLTRWSYDPADPFAVSVEFVTGGDDGPVRWLFARELVADGVDSLTQVGGGDVRCWRVPVLGGPDEFGLWLRSPDGVAEFRFDRDAVYGFVLSTCSACPLGDEAARIAEAEWAQLLEGTL